MWPLIVLLIPLCGYLYIESDPFLSYKLKKLDGWHAYFMAATQGVLLAVSLFASLLKFIITVIVLIVFASFVAGLLVGISALMREWEDTSISSVFSTFMTPFIETGVTVSDDFFASCVELISTNASSNKVAAIFGLLLILYVLEKSSKQSQESQSPTNKESIKAKISNDNKIEAMFFEAEKSGLLIMVTLKSRKAYVGQVIGEDSGYTNGKEVAIIPILSGYRDKDTLSFKVEHDYSKHYLEEKISSESTPSLDQFRQILFFDQIESMSLFNSETYKKFQSLSQMDIADDFEEGNRD